MKIRKAIPQYLPAMVAYGKGFWEQTAFFKENDIPYCFKTVTRMAAECMDNGVALVATDDKANVKGLMLCLVLPFPMNDSYKQAVEWVFYVDPSERKSGLGAKLIAAAEDQLREDGVRLLSMVCLTNITPDAAISLYEKLGYKHSETSMTKDLR